MWSVSDIFQAGKAALAAKEAAAPPPYFAPVADVAVEQAQFDPASFPWRDRVYRITFKNGNSGEYNGAVLAHTFPFDPHEVNRVEHVEDVGK